MKIKTLIKVYKELIPYYERAVENKKNSYLSLGLCYAAYFICNKCIHGLFDHDGYYRHYIDEKSMFLKGSSRNLSIIKLYKFSGSTMKDIKLRLNFMKQEIIELQNLLSEGYTDV